MRSIHVVHLDKWRPALILTRAIAIPTMRKITVAPITSTIRGLATELSVGARNGLDHDCVISLDNLVTVPREAIGEAVGYLLANQEAALTEAIHAAFDLD
jgi:mRNA interferase MazF